MDDIKKDRGWKIYFLLSRHTSESNKYFSDVDAKLLPSIICLRQCRGNSIRYS